MQTETSNIQTHKDDDSNDASRVRVVLNLAAGSVMTADDDNDIISKLKERSTFLHFHSPKFPPYLPPFLDIFVFVSSHGNFCAWMFWVVVVLVKLILGSFIFATGFSILKVL